MLCHTASPTDTRMQREDWVMSGALAPSLVSRRAARGRRAGGWGDAAAARGEKEPVFFLSVEHYVSGYSGGRRGYCA
jgi:hypothetical protein